MLFTNTFTMMFLVILYSAKASKRRWSGRGRRALIGGEERAAPWVFLDR